MINTSSFRSKPFVCIFVAILTLLATESCVNKIDDDTAESKPVVLRVTTRSAADIPYPVRLYAFTADDGKPVAETILESSSDGTLALALAAGSYKLVALAGTAHCTLPASPTLATDITIAGATITAPARH